MTFDDRQNLALTISKLKPIYTEGAQAETLCRNPKVVSNFYEQEVQQQKSDSLLLGFS